jgi:hypothetical protein
MTTKAKAFVSYHHTDADWVLSRLTQALEAAGVEVLLDVERFRVGHGVIGEMDRTQDLADRQLLVLTHGYFTSDYCQHEFDRALGSRAFADGRAVPIRRDRATWPQSLKDVLYADLQDDQSGQGWRSLLSACGGDLGTSVPHWLEVGATVARHLQRRESVNLIVDSGLNGDLLVEHLAKRRLPTPLVPELKVIDLDSGRTATREGLLREILRVFGCRAELPSRPHDLVRFAELMDELPHGWLALQHFDAVGGRQSEYTIELFRELRYRATTRRALTLLLQSRGPYGVVLPHGHPMSEIPCNEVFLQKLP